MKRPRRKPPAERDGLASGIKEGHGRMGRSPVSFFGGDPWDNWDLADAMAADFEHAATVAGSAAVVFDWLWLPDRDQAEQDLDNVGIRGTPQGEAVREQVLASLELTKRRAAEWRASVQGDRQVSAETSAVSPAGYSEQMDETLTIAETAARLGYSEQYARRLAKRGELPAHKSDNGAWMVDRSSVELRAAEAQRDAG